MSGVLKVGDQVKSTFGVATVLSLEVTSDERQKYGEPVESVSWDEPFFVADLDNSPFAYRDQLEPVQGPATWCSPCRLSCRPIRSVAGRRSAGWSSGVSGCRRVLASSLTVMLLLIRFFRSFFAGFLRGPRK